MLTEKYSHIGLKLENGLPEFYHAFNNGAFTADIGRSGGIDRLAFIDIRYADEMMFPNRWYSEMLNRKGWHLGRPMYGPAVKFISTAADGTVFHHAPLNGRKLPYGLITEQNDDLFGRNEYHIFLERDLTLRILASADSGTFATFDIVISKYHFAGGKYMIRQNQLLNHEYGIDMLPENIIDPDYFKNIPFSNVHGEMNWTDFNFDEAANAHVCSAVRKFKDGTERPLYMLFGCSEKCTVIETEQNFILRCQHNYGNKIAASVAIGENLQDLKEKVSLTFEETQKHLELLLENIEAIEKSSPEIYIENHPEISDFARIARTMQQAAVIEDETDYAAILAAFGKFGYFIAWDHNYPIRDFITTGDFKTAQKLIRYGIDYPYMETVPFSVAQLILAVNELTAFSGNCDFLKENYPKLLDMFLYLENFIDREKRMLKTTHCCGVDNPAEIGLSKFFYAACLNSWHYAATYAMANFALIMHDETLAEKFYNQAEKHKESYIRYFYNEKTGTLRAAVNDDFSCPDIEVFHNSSSIGLDYPCGEYLLRKGISSIADYYKTKLRHPDGYSAITYNSDSPCEMWRSVYMNQHIGHNTRIHRLNNDMQEANRVAEHYFKEFEKSLNAIETFNLEGCDGDISQRVNWQSFSCTAALHCIHQTLAGIAWTRGGLVYLPADDSRKISMSGFIFDGRKWNISINGNGSFVNCIKLNGETFKNTMQIPSDLINSKECSLEIIRSAEIPQTPVLLYAVDTKIKNFEVSDKKIRFRIAGDSFGIMKFFAEKTPELTVNGKRIETEYFADNHTLWCNCRFYENDVIECLYV